MAVLKLITIMLEQYFVIYLDFFSLTKGITKGWSVTVVMSLNN